MRAVVAEGRNRDGSRDHPSGAARRDPAAEPAPDGDPVGGAQPGGGRIVAFGTLPAGPPRHPAPRPDRIAAMTGFDPVDMVTAPPPDGALPPRPVGARPSVQPPAASRPARGVGPSAPAGPPSAAPAPPRPAPGEASTGRTRQTFRAVAFGNPTAGGAEVVPFDPADVGPPTPWRPDPPDRSPTGEPPADPYDRADRSDPAGFRRTGEYGGEPDPPRVRGFRADAPPGWRGFRGADPPGGRGFPASDPPGGRRFPGEHAQPAVDPVPEAPDPRRGESGPSAAGPPRVRPAAPSLLDQVSYTGIQQALPAGEPDPASTRGRRPDGGSAQDEVDLTGYQPAIREGEGWEPRGAARGEARPPAGAGRVGSGRPPPTGERARSGGRPSQAGDPAVGTAGRRDGRPGGRFDGLPGESRSLYDTDDRERDRDGGRDRPRAGDPADRLGARPAGRRRPGGRPGGRLGLVQAALVLAVLVVGVSLGRTLALPGDAGMISRLPDWGRANHLSFLVDRVDGPR
ncbi:hypothetical protein FraQA3DRAFT_5032 [Frankia sp. QA3]|nr:hypothetical protein FraQA3DRAFT_5032 [Frankia sp. QA3]